MRGERAWSAVSPLPLTSYLSPLTTFIPLTYDQAIDFLFPRTTTIKFGLGTTRALLAEVGTPQDVMPLVHVGGTNGKGSVCTLLASVLREAGWRVGLYTSPHLVSFRERIRVDGEPISEAAVAMWTERLKSLIRRRAATFFEATTAIALADFAARGAEIGVIEVGLGGRLDSTNVIRPLVLVGEDEAPSRKFFYHLFFLEFSQNPDQGTPLRFVQAKAALDAVQVGAIWCNL